MKLFSRLLISFVVFHLFIKQGQAHASGELEIKYSFGFMKSKILDERDNSIIYGNSKFQPFYVGLRFSHERWMHHLSFYFNQVNLKPFEGGELFSYNYVKYSYGELSYDLLYKLLQKDDARFFFSTGIGLHAFGSLRLRESYSSKYPYEDMVTSYDINSASFQIIASPSFKFKKSIFSMIFSTGILNNVTRPASYNPLFNSNDGKWDWVSFKRHFNLQAAMEYKFILSKRITACFEYRFFYYSYSFPYRYKALNQNYLAGLIYKF